MWKNLPVILLCVAIATPVLSAQQTPVLTTQDYVDIQQLYASLTEYLDTGTDAGARYANGYTSDGVLEAEDGKVYKGRAAIIDFANADEAAQRVAGHDPRPGEQPFRQRLHGCRQLSPA